MLNVLLCLIGGIIAGYLLRKKSFTQRLDKPIFYTIILLLFLLGISVGSNKEIIEGISTLGAHAIIMGASTALGSVLMAGLFYRLFFRKKNNHER